MITSKKIKECELKIKELAEIICGLEIIIRGRWRFTKDEVERLMKAKDLMETYQVKLSILIQEAKRVATENGLKVGKLNK